MRVRRFVPWSLLCAALLVGFNAAAAPMTRAQARAALAHSEPEQRLAGVRRLAEIGTQADADALLGTVGDADERARVVTVAAVWQIWSRSGDAAVDKLFAQGVGQMEAAQFNEALHTFHRIVRRKPAFAEGWNKRATVYFLLGRYQESLKDCDEVLKRNPKHFGALSGAGQIHLQLGNARSALEYFRRALEVNPALDGPSQVIPLLEQIVREQSGRPI